MSRYSFKTALSLVWNDFETYKASNTKLSFRNYLRKKYAGENEQNWFENLRTRTRFEINKHDLSQAIDFLNEQHRFYKMISKINH